MAVKALDLKNLEFFYLAMWYGSVFSFMETLSVAGLGRCLACSRVRLLSERASYRIAPTVVGLRAVGSYLPHSPQAFVVRTV
jgi:hypothetical protein